MKLQNHMTELEFSTKNKNMTRIDQDVEVRVIEPRAVLRNCKKRINFSSARATPTQYNNYNYKNICYPPVQIDIF